MKFSLIIGTLNRLESLKLCLQSIFDQTEKDWEIIIIDQSDDDQTERYIKSLNAPNIVYKHVNFKGLSRARNEALKLASGEYFALIDDDARYDCDFLEEASRQLDSKTVLSGYIWDTVNECPMVNYKGLTYLQSLKTRQLFTSCPSSSLVIPFCAVEDIGYFDDDFGVGSKYGAGEETDYLLRLMYKGYVVRFDDKMKVKHPYPAVMYKMTREQELKKRYAYSYGIGALCKKHYLISRDKYPGIHYKMKKIKLCIKSIFGSKFYYAKGELKALVSGYTEYNKEK